MNPYSLSYFNSGGEPYPYVGAIGNLDLSSFTSGGEVYQGLYTIFSPEPTPASSLAIVVGELGTGRI